VQGGNRRLVPGPERAAGFQLDEWLHRITEELAAWDRDNPDRPSAPFAVNQIVFRTNDRLEHDLGCA
jgi:hypothetical protein